MQNCFLNIFLFLCVKYYVRKVSGTGYERHIFVSFLLLPGILADTSRPGRLYRLYRGVCICAYSRSYLIVSDIKV